MTDNNYKFKFSVVMSVYNTAQWLEQAVDSVIYQDIGFEENVQIIFINDGSTDSSEAICLSYQKRYPKNIVYKKQKNGGLAHARNVGLELVEGKYTSFFDSDDELSLDSLREVYNFFEDHHSEIDLVSIKMEFFEARSGPHPLNYKFKEDAVIDIKKQFDYAQLSAMSSFFKTSAFGKLRFDPKLRISEDTQLVPRFICQKMQYGVVANPTCFYRRRANTTSIIDNKFKSDYWFTQIVPGVYQYLIDWSVEQYGVVLKFIQFLILYDLQGPLMANRPEVLSDSQFRSYKTLLYNLLSYMDDDVILSQRKLKREYKYYLLSKKYDESVVKSANRKGLQFYFKGNKLYDYDRQTPKVYIEKLVTDDKGLYLQGRFTGFYFKGVALDLFVNGIKIDTQKINIPEKSVYFIHYKNYFETTIKTLNSSTDFSAYIDIDGQRISVPVKYGERFQQTNSVDAGVCLSGNHVLISARDATDGTYTKIVELSKLQNKKIYQSGAFLEGAKNTTKLLLTEELLDTKALVVYTKNNQIHYYIYPNNSKTPYEPLMQVRALALWSKVTRQKLRIFYASYILNPYNISIDEQYVYVDNANYQQVRLLQTKSIIPGPTLLKTINNQLHLANFNLARLLKGEDIPINTGVKIKLTINGRELNHSISIPKKKLKNPLMYYLPRSVVKLYDKFTYLRSNNNRSLILVRRPIESIEKTVKFRVLEFLPLSFMLYHLAKSQRKFSKKQVNLYFEKNAEKADEGAFETFQKSRQVAKRSKNYFILADNSPDYDRIGNKNGVVRKFSFKYYWLTYRSNNFIATEAPSHINITRTKNRYIRRSLYEKRFVFLQHGITYLKSQTKTTAFSKGKDSEPTYMLVSSKREQTVVADMLSLPKNRLLVTGLPVFDTIKYQHISQSSSDIVTIMLTWKPYEEHITDFTKTSYYKNTVALAKLLNQFLPSKNIRLVAHPRVTKSLKATGLANVWDGNIPDAFGDCKLAITDYSSICYYSFYQGAAVIFYQPDIDIYEQQIGQLIPQNGEYIGKRVFDLRKVRSILEQSINGGEITSKHLRGSEFIKRYQEINQFHDGINIDRLCEQLKKLGII